jgi:GT2 family glycosyltransferase
MTKKIGFVIVNYNDSEETIKLINNIKDYNSINKMVIVDNNSSDDSFVKLKEYKSKKIDIIKNNNRHYSSGLNKGAKYLVKELGDCNIIFSNSDISIKSEKDIIRLNDDMKDDVVVVGPSIDEHGVIKKGWKMPTTNHEILDNLILISRFFRNQLLYKDDYYKGDTTFVDVVSGCFFMVNSKFLKEVGYFDENTFLYYEEQILASKVKDNNKKELVDNKVTIKHNHSVTIDKSINRVKKHKILKASQRYFCKNYLKANIFQMFLLQLTDKIFLITLYIRCLFRV